MDPPEQESINPNVVLPAIGGSKRRVSAIGGTPSRQQPKRKAKDRRRVSFAPDTELTLVHEFIKDDELSGGSGGKARIPNIPCAAWEEEDLTAPVVVAVCSPGQMSDMELTGPLGPMGADSITADVPSLGTLLDDEPDLAGVEQDAGITADVPRLSSLVEEEEEGMAWIGGEEGQQAVEGAPQLAGAMQGEQTDITAQMDLTLVHGSITVDDASYVPVAPAGDLGEQDPQASLGTSSSPGPSPGVLEEDSTAASLVAPLSEPSEGTLPNLASKWGFNPGSEDTMELDLAAHGRMMMGDNTFGRLFGDLDDSHELSEDAAPAERTGASSEGDDAEVTADQDEHADEQHFAVEPSSRDLPHLAGGLINPIGDTLHPSPSSTPNKTGPDSEPRQAAPDSQPATGPFGVQSLGPQWTAPAFVPPYMQSAAVVAPPLAEPEAAVPIETNPLPPSLEQAPGPPSPDNGKDNLSDLEPSGAPAGPAHPALVNSPDLTASSLGSLPGRPDRLSIDSRRVSIGGFQGDATGRLLLDDPTQDSGSFSGARERRSSITSAHRRVSDVSGLAWQDLTLGLLNDDEPRTGNGSGQGSPDPKPTMPEGSALFSPPGAASTPAAAKHQEGNGVLGTPQASTSNTGRRQQEPSSVAPPSAPSPGVAPTATLALLRSGGTTRLLAGSPLIHAGASTQGGMGHVTRTMGATGRLLLDGTLTGEVLLGSGTSDPGLEPGSAMRQARQPAAAFPGGPLLPRTPVSAFAVEAMRTPGGGTRGVTSSRPLPPSASRSAARHGPGSAGFPLPTPTTTAALSPAGSVARGGGISPSASLTSASRQQLSRRSAGSAMLGSVAKSGGRVVSRVSPARLAPPPNLTFQDFSHALELRFLDGLRRGTSIAYADLAPNEPPRDLVGAYRLLALQVPAAEELGQGVATLGREVADRRAAAAEAEVLAGRANPPAMQAVAAALAQGGRRLGDDDDESLRGLKAQADLLRRVCRAKALAVLKDVRVQMEESRAARLGRAAAALRADAEYVQATLRGLASLDRATTRAEEEITHAEERRADAVRISRERHDAVSALGCRVEAAAAANAERRAAVEAARAAAIDRGVRNDELRKRADELHRASATTSNETPAGVANDGNSNEDITCQISRPAARAAAEAMLAQQAVVGVRVLGRPAAPPAFAVANGWFAVELISSQGDELVANVTLLCTPTSAAARSLVCRGVQALSTQLLSAPAGAHAISTPLAEVVLGSGLSRLAAVQSLCRNLGRLGRVAAALEATHLAGGCFITDAECVPCAGPHDVELRLHFVRLAAGVRLDVFLPLTEGDVATCQNLITSHVGSAGGETSKELQARVELEARACAARAGSLDELVGSTARAVAALLAQLPAQTDRPSFRPNPLFAARTPAAAC